MRAIKIDPENRSIEEIELAVDPNRSLGELRSIIGTDDLELIPLDKGFNLLAGLHDEQKPSFGFCDLDEPVIHGVAVVLGGSPHRLRALRENKVDVSPLFFKKIHLKIHKTQKIRKPSELELTSKINNCLVYFEYFMVFLCYFLRLYRNKKGTFDIFCPVLTKK